METSATKETSKALFVESNLYFLCCSALVLILQRDVCGVKNFKVFLFLLYVCSENYFCSSSVSPPLFISPHHLLTLYNLGEAHFPREQTRICDKSMQGELGSFAVYECVQY